MSPSFRRTTLLLVQSAAAFTVTPIRTTTTTTLSIPPLCLSDPKKEDSGSEKDGNNNNNDTNNEDNCDEDGECEIDWDAMPTAQEVVDAASMRDRLEMSWQLDEAKEECDVQIPETCGSEPCQECAGKGWNPCRFCRGTTTLFLPSAGVGDNSQFRACTICHEGHERCRSCQGSGWVANWTSLQGTAH